MVTDDVKQLLQTLNDCLAHSLEAAAGFAVKRGHPEVTPEHLVLKVLEQEDSDYVRALRHFDVDPGRLETALVHYVEEFRTGNAGRPSFAPALLQLVESAWLLGSVHHGLSSVRTGTLLAAMVRSDTLTTRGYMDVLSAVYPEELRAQLPNLMAESGEGAAPSSDDTGTGAAAPEGEQTVLDRYTLSFTQQARDGEIDPISCRNEEIRQITDILSRRRKNNPILVGDAGVGKTAIVEGLARRVADGDVPDRLADIEIRSLDLGALKAGASMQGEFEERLKSVMTEVKEAPTPTILFIDEAHTLIGAGGNEGTGDAANLLKPALARGELRAIAATTWSEYKKYIEKDPALERRFQRIKVEEPSVEEATTMLRGIRSAYEAHHDVPVTEAAVEATAELAGRYISGRQLPDKAVDVLDTAAARVKMSRSARPGRLDDLDRRLDTLKTEIEGLERDLASGLRDEADDLEALKDEYEAVRAERDELEEQWKEERALVGEISDVRSELSTATNGTAEAVPEATTAPADLGDLQEKLNDTEGEQPLVHGAVTEQVVAEVVSDWTGIPVGSMLEDEAARLLSLEDRLGSAILGQASAVREVSKAVRTSKAGLNAPDSPLGVFLFTGPSGVGKTETARRLADFLFGGERFLTTINMSEYQEKHTAAQLKGSPPGYVGYGEGGVLTEAVRRQPYSVVLLDEIEKAHRDVMNLFYQVFDKGFMRDGEGREIDFRNTIIIMTSNLASDTITQLVRGTDEADEGEDPEEAEAEPNRDDRPSVEQVREAIHPTLVEHFQPALLGRMRVVPYVPLDTETMRGITEIKLGDVADRLQEVHGIDFVYAPEVVDTIAARCTQVDAGARNIDTIIHRTLLPETAEALIPRMAEDDLPSTLTLGLDSDGDFTYTFD
ncbi:ClpV1 family T6SS ATPase [Salinibacter sp. 10B]|uniref:type VI secretion system ATPase TssH n=1 Tax=Salinibacter sp. 10B TaxID=1923971 RepID=UPI000CF51CF2|nr:type VI secretion system ATPase TssH [Salinibacter sp. 10B]PQJ33905.1 ClpV1 family T6SS ATPase [Salinibacter sp. 10B]